MKLWQAILILTCFSVAAATPEWRLEKYSLKARQLPVRSALEAFGVAQGVGVVMSEAVTGSFSGDFIEKPATDFLNDLAAMHALTWYFDGSAIFVYGASEIASAMLDLQYMDVDEVKETMRELGVEDARFPIKTARNGELILVSGPPRYVALVLQTIERADNLRKVRTFKETETRIFRLKNTWAEDVSFTTTGPESNNSTFPGVATMLRELMASQDLTRDMAMTNTAEELSHAVPVRSIIRADPRLNAVVVRDSVVKMPMYEKLIRELDVPQPLVEIAVTTVEMTRENSLDWQASVKVTGSHKEISAGAGQNIDNLSYVPTLAGQGAAGALTYLGKHVTVDASLSALRRKGKLRSLSRSSILTLNNLGAEMSDRQSYHAKVVGKEVAALSQVTAGTSLGVKPRIVAPAREDTNTPTRVWLTLELTDGGFEAVSVDSLPMSRQTRVTTQAAVVEDESIMLAGYFRTIEEEDGWGIPYLRDIPWIGWLFGGASKVKQDVQRLFIFTPHVVDWTDYAYSNTNRISEAGTRLRDRQLLKRAQEDIDAEDAEEERKRREEEKKKDEARKNEAEMIDADSVMLRHDDTMPVKDEK